MSALEDLDGYSIGEIRKMAGLTQGQLGERMRPPVSQPGVAQIERRTMEGIRVASVRRYVEALGGELHLVAVFPQESYIIDERNGR